MYLFVALLLIASCAAHRPQPVADHCPSAAEQAKWVEGANVLPTETTWWICRPDKDGDLHCMDLHEAADQASEAPPKEL